MRHFFSILLFFSSVNNLSAQEYISEGRNRLNFAKTYLELGGQYSPSFTGKILDGNNPKSVTNSSSIIPYLNIGGIHFWGHADFYISIPLTQLNLNKNDNSQFRLNQSAVTGARFLPWAFKDKKIRPYVGASWVVVNFKQNENLPLLSKNKLLFDAGILYGKGSIMARAGANFYPSSTWNYPVAKDNFQTINTPSWSANLGIVYAFETTRSKNMETENKRLNNYSAISKPSLNAIKKSDWFIGIGPSSSFILSNSEYNETNFPYLNKKSISNTYLDVAVGFQFNKAGIVTALSFRNPKFTNDAFGTKQIIKKNSLTFEAFKFLTDYSGFTPYLGVNLAYDNIKYLETTSTTNLNNSYNQINPGLTFGWDILPGKTEQWFVLRTNLRWYPFSKININGKVFSQNQLEYNVIQAVFYPSRFKNVKSKKDK